jgi:hypothetical protein
MSSSQGDSRYLLYSALIFSITFFLCSLMGIPAAA